MRFIRTNKRFIAATLLLSIVNQVIFPNIALAYDGGPNQAEHSKAPAGNLVNPYTGEFSYSIPIVNMGGEYAFSLDYNSGNVNMLSVPGAVGEGFNLSCFEQVSRQTVELPDDFYKDPIQIRNHVKPYTSVSINFPKGATEEIFGFKNPFFPSLSAQSTAFKDKIKDIKLHSIYWNSIKGVGFTVGSAAGYKAFSYSPRFDSQSGYGHSVGVNTGKNLGWLGATIDWSAQNKLNNVGINALIVGGMSFGYSRVTGSSIPMNTQVNNLKIELGLGNTGNGVGVGPLTATRFKLDRKNFLPFSFVYVPITYLLKDENAGIAKPFSPGKPSEFDVSIATSKVGHEREVKKAIGYLYHNPNDQFPNSIEDYMHEQKSQRKGDPFLAGSKPGKDVFIMSGGSSGGSFTLKKDAVQVFSAPYSRSETTSRFIEGEFGLNLPTVQDIHIGVGVNLVHGSSMTRAIPYKENKFGLENHSNSYFKMNGESNTEQSNQNTISSWGGSVATAMDMKLEGSYFDNEKRFVAKSINGNNLYSGNQQFLGDDQRSARESYVQYFTHQEAENFGYTRNTSYFDRTQGENHFTDQELSQRSKHIAELNIYRGGSKLSYGFPVYNKWRKDIVASLEQTNPTPGLAKYEVNIPAANGNANKEIIYGKSADGFSQEYLKEIQIPQYATAWKLYSITSDDYIDLNQNGKVDNDDRGGWVAFDYDYDEEEGSYISNYRWRSRVEGADLIAGVKGLKNDDMITLSTGVKEVVYVKSIDTKNYTTKFYYSDRLDGYPVLEGINGGIDIDGKPLQKVDSIKVFIKQYDALDENNLPSEKLVQTTTFNYDYSISKNIPSNSKVALPENSRGGKLTLLSVSSTFYNSNKGNDYSYSFEYNTNDPVHNPVFNRQNIDRWGDFKRNFEENGDVVSNNYPYKDFPSASQEIDVIAPYKLKRIVYPNGSFMDVTYERNSYSHVEDKEALQMFDIVSMEDVTQANHMSYISDLSLNENRNILDPSTFNKESLLSKDHVIIKLPNSFKDITDLERRDFFYKNYLDGITDGIYLKVYTRLGTKYEEKSASDPNVDQEGDWDFVDVLASIDPNDYAVISVDSDGDGDDDTFYGKIKLNERSTSGITYTINPIRFAAFEHIKNNRSEFMYGIPEKIISIYDIASNALAGLGDMLLGASATLEAKLAASKWRPHGWSAVRLKSPKGEKFGGGWRVAKISHYDNWKKSSIATVDKNQLYSQKYSYEVNIGNARYPEYISSGVAYEPSVGMEENANLDFYEFKEPVLAFEQGYGLVKGTPLDFHMPGPSVGYRKVIVEQEYEAQQEAAISRSIAPHTEYEFYTPLSHPTIKTFTELGREKLLPQMYNFAVTDVVSVSSVRRGLSQGQSLVKNNMAGALKRISERTRTNSIISEQEYIYNETTLASKEPKKIGKHGEFGTISKSKVVVSPLTNLIDENKTVSPGKLGEDYDIWVDMTQKIETQTGQYGITGNLGVTFQIPFIKYIVPIMDKKQVYSESSENTVVTNKVIMRSGIIKEVITRKDNSEITSNYLLFDKKYGGLVLSNVENEHAYDPNAGSIYKFSHQGYWEYPSFNGKYLNQDKKINSELIVSNESFTMPSGLDLQDYFRDGDYVSFKVNNEFIQGYIDLVNLQTNTFSILDLNNEYINTDVNSIRVINSAYTNYTSVGVGQEVSQTTNFNPSNSNYVLDLNNHVNVSAITYYESWKGQCCIFQKVPNKYQNRTANTWRPYKSYVYNDKRDYTSPGNTKNDGLILNYVTFDWQNLANNTKWIETGEAITYGADGQLKEQKNALDLFYSTLFGYSGDLVRSATSNSSLSESVFDGFEEYNYVECFVDGDLDVDKAIEEQGQGEIYSGFSHTGKFSLKVGPGQKVEVETIILNCND